MQGRDLLIEDLPGFFVHRKVLCDFVCRPIRQPNPGSSPEHSPAHRYRTADRDVSRKQVLEQKQEQAGFGIGRIAQLESHLEVAARQHLFFEKRASNDPSGEPVNGNPRLPPALAVF